MSYVYDKLFKRKSLICNELRKVDFRVRGVGLPNGGIA